MPVRDRDLLISAARTAGEIAMGYFNADPQVWHKDEGAGPVTEADISVDTALRHDLMEARPDYGWLSEETQDTEARLSTECQFIVDPIDGTRAFVAGAPDWAHSLAVVRGGVVTAAAVYLPVRDLMFAAVLGGGATLNGAPIAVSARSELTGADVLSPKGWFEPKFWRDGLPPDVTRSFRSSLAYRLCRVAEGRADAMITLRPSWEWDIAAGALIVTEAGGAATDRTGAALRFNNPHPQVNGVVAGGGVQRGLLDRLARD